MKQNQIAGLEQEINRNYPNTTGILVHHNGNVSYEKYFHGYAPKDTIHIASATKSIISALFGIAMELGYIKHLDQPVLDFFPDYTVKRGEKTIQHVTIRNLLTMTAPYKYKSEPYTRVFSSDDWVKSALDLLGGKGEIGKFKYSPMVGIHILSGILVNATGQTVMDFAVQHLFSPLGIHVGQSVTLHNKKEHLDFIRTNHKSGWVVDPKGIHTAGWGLTLTPGDMAKIGQLYLNGGSFHQKQVIPAAWIEESTREQSRWNQLAYGYLWWVIDGKERVYAALGDGGNVIYVNAGKHLVVSMAALFMPRAKDRIVLIKEYIEPMFRL